MALTLDTGLRHRLRRALRRMEAQHARMRPLLREAEDALGSGGALARLRDALRAHFDLEEGVLFPALRGLSPPSQSALERLSDEHRAFLAELTLLETAARSAEAFPHLRRALGEHERREEQLLESLVGALRER